MGRDDTWGEYSAARFESALRARVVGYEFWALATSARHVNTIEDVYLAQNVVDACLVHARCCTEFLVGRLNKRGQRSWKAADVRPLDFINSWDPKPVEAVTHLDRYLPLLDKHLAHVSIARVDLFGHRWDIDELHRAVEAVARTFRTELKGQAPEKFAELEPWFRYADKARGASLPDDTRDSDERKSVRTGLDLMMISPDGVPLGAWAAWSQRYMQEKGIEWPK